jgi:hypothetical protein
MGLPSDRAHLAPAAVHIEAGLGVFKACKPKPGRMTDQLLLCCTSISRGGLVMQLSSRFRFLVESAPTLTRELQTMQVSVPPPHTDVNMRPNH